MIEKNQNQYYLKSPGRDTKNITLYTTILSVIIIIFSLEIVTSHSFFLGIQYFFLIYHNGNNIIIKT